MQEAQGLAEALGLVSEQWQLLAKLGELYQAAGHADKAQQMVTQANEIVQALAANIGNEQLRLGFLAAAHPERRVIMQVPKRRRELIASTHKSPVVALYFLRYQSTINH
jgi:hypothetical protein